MLNKIPNNQSENRKRTAFLLNVIPINEIASGLLCSDSNNQHWSVFTLSAQQFVDI